NGSAFIVLSTRLGTTLLIEIFDCSSFLSLQLLVDCLQKLLAVIAVVGIAAGCCQTEPGCRLQPEVSCAQHIAERSQSGGVRCQLFDEEHALRCRIAAFSQSEQSAHAHARIT